MFVNSSELEGLSMKKRNTPLNMKPDALGRYTTWYMQMYHTQQMEHVKLEVESYLIDLSRMKQNLKRRNNENKCQ